MSSTRQKKLKLPKLRIIRPGGYPFEEIRDIKDARYLTFDYKFGTIVLVDRQVVKSYDELVKLAEQDCYKGKEFVDVVITPVALPGG